MDNFCFKIRCLLVSVTKQLLHAFSAASVALSAFTPVLSETALPPAVTTAPEAKDVKSDKAIDPTKMGTVQFELNGKIGVATCGRARMGLPMFASATNQGTIFYAPAWGELSTWTAFYPKLSNGSRGEGRMVNDYSSDSDKNLARDVITAFNAAGGCSIPPNDNEGLSASTLIDAAESAQDRVQAFFDRHPRLAESEKVEEPPLNLPLTASTRVEQCAVEAVKRSAPKAQLSDLRLPEENRSFSYSITATNFSKLTDAPDRVSRAEIFIELNNGSDPSRDFGIIVSATIQVGNRYAPITKENSETAIFVSKLGTVNASVVMQNLWQQTRRAQFDPVSHRFFLNHAGDLNHSDSYYNNAPLAPPGKSNVIGTGQRAYGDLFACLSKLKGPKADRPQGLVETRSDHHPSR